MKRPHNLGPAKSPRFSASLATDGALELCIYGDIVDASTISMLEAWGYATDDMTCALGVKKALDTGGSFSKVRLRINSPGGDAVEGMAIHSLLSACGKPVEAYIDGIAASSASIIAMAAGTRVMGRVSMMMVHNAWSDCRGNKADMLKMADTLDTVDASIAVAYVDRTGKSLDQIKALMDAETWLSAQDCMDQGFATGIAPLPDEQEASAMASARSFQAAYGRYRHVPEALKATAAAPPPVQVSADACECECEACQDGDCANCSNKDCEDANCKDCPMQNDDEMGDSSNLSLYEARAAMLLRGRAS